MKNTGKRSDFRCENCVYWKPDALPPHLGTCIRFPKVEPKDPKDGCGEFRFTWPIA